MSVPREEILKKVRQWFRYAQDDLSVARMIANDSDAPQRIAAYHAQQATEKALKAWLIYKEVDFPFTHDLSLLLSNCEKNGAHWSDGLSAIVRLGEYATTTRYPDFELLVTSEQANEAIELATSTVNTVQSALKNEGLEL